MLKEWGQAYILPGSVIEVVVSGRMNISLCVFPSGVDQYGFAGRYLAVQQATVAPDQKQQCGAENF